MAKQQKVKIELTAKEVFSIIDVLEEYHAMMNDHEHAQDYVKLIKKAFKRNKIDVDKISNAIVDDAKAPLASMGIGNTTDIN